MAWLDFLKSDPGAENYKPQFGLFGGGGQIPLSGSQKAQQIFAGLRDAISSFNGEDGHNLSDVQGQILGQRSRSALADATSGLGEGKPFDLSAYLAGGGDPMTGIQLWTASQKKAEPRIFNTPDGPVDVTDPTHPSLLYRASQHAPPGYHFSTDGQSLVAIPGGPADPHTTGALAASRRKPASAPRPPAAAKVDGPF